jgi:hypothetical protein
VVGGLGSKLIEARAQFVQDVGINWQPVPVVPLAPDAYATAHKVQVFPPTGKHFGPPQTSALHQQDWRAFVASRGRPNEPKLVEARPVDVGLALRRPADLPRRIDVDEILRLRPREERVEHRDHVRPG